MKTFKLVSIVLINLTTLIFLSLLMMDVDDNFNMDILKYIQEKSYPWKLVPIAWILWFIVNGLFIYKYLRKKKN